MSVALEERTAMKDKERDITEPAPTPEAPPEAAPVDGGDAGAPPADTPAPSVAPSAEAELAELKDKYLRLAAEFDNFRKRAARERADVWIKAQADLVQRLVDSLDDLSRFAHVDPATTDAKTIHDGVDMVERKVWKVLDGAGVKRIDEIGAPFDPSLHEAVTTAPAPSREQDHTVGQVLQPGYQVGGVLIRPARVAVLVWSDDTAQPTAKSQ
jgi:molecular chaperone GrpE